MPGTATPTPAARPTEPSTPKPTPNGPGPAADTVHVDDRYRARYAGRYVGWDELLGRRPEATGEDRRLSLGLEGDEPRHRPELEEGPATCVSTS